MGTLSGCQWLLPWKDWPEGVANCYHGNIGQGLPLIVTIRCHWLLPWYHWSDRVDNYYHWNMQCLCNFWWKQSAAISIWAEQIEPDKEVRQSNGIVHLVSFQLVDDCSTSWVNNGVIERDSDTFFKVHMWACLILLERQLISLRVINVLCWSSPK